MRVPWDKPWHVEEVDPAVVERLAVTHLPYREATEMGVDISVTPTPRTTTVQPPLLPLGRTDVTPGSTVVVGSVIRNYLAKVVAWDFEVSDTDPIVVLDLLPVTPKSVADALAVPGRRPPETSAR